MRPFSFYPGPYPMNPYQMMPGGFSPFMRAPSFMPRMPMPGPGPMSGPIPTAGPMQALRAAIPTLGGGAPTAGGAAAMPRLDSFLQTANSFMNTAQKFTPYVQQAAPMIKNLPALWRMYRGFSNSSDESESTTIRDPRESRNMRESFNFEDDGESFNVRDNRKPKKRVELTTKPSIPRIYQPPLDIF